MRLMCIKIISNNTCKGLNNEYCLTIGKQYDIYGINSIGYKVINDNDYLGWCVKDYFESIDEMRDNKLKEIGI